MEKNYCFMAFSQGSESKDVVVKRYVGVAPVKILAVNPTKAEFEKIFNTTLENEIDYTGTQEVEGVQVPTARLDFIVETDAANCNDISMTTKVTFFLRNQPRLNQDGSKAQVIDKYGRTCWVTKEELQNHAIPQYKNGPANIDPDYRPCFVGEENLTKFIKSYLNIPDVMRYINNEWVMVDNPQECLARLENIADYFKGNFKEMLDVISLQPTNKVKVLFGVKTGDDNRQFQSFFQDEFLKNSSNNFKKIEKALNQRKEAGAYGTTSFEVCELKEHVVEASNLSNPTVTAAPATTASPWPFGN